VEMENTSFSFRTRIPSFGEQPLLRDFSMKMVSGEIVAMVGPSGCGKSTIARLIAGLLIPDSGRVIFKGQSVSGPSRERGLIAQGDWCLPWFTVRNNVQLGLSDPSHWGKAKQLLEVAGLKDSLERYPSELSFGGRQRVCLVRALVAGADVLMLDEPLSAVDAVRKTSLEQTIRATLKAAGASALWITHDLDEALLVSDRLLVVGGRPLTILHDEGLERRPDDIQGMIGSSAFQMHRIELHRRVAELWPADRL